MGEDVNDDLLIASGDDDNEDCEGSKIVRLSNTMRRFKLWKLESW